MVWQKASGSAMLQSTSSGTLHACSHATGQDITYRSESFGVIMNGCQVLDGVEADPEDCALGDEVAPNMHIPRSDPVCARRSRVQPQRLLQAACTLTSMKL